MIKIDVILSPLHVFQSIFLIIEFRILPMCIYVKGLNIFAFMEKQVVSFLFSLSLSVEKMRTHHRIVYGSAQSCTPKFDKSYSNAVKLLCDIRHALLVALVIADFYSL